MDVFTACQQYKYLPRAWHIALPQVLTQRFTELTKGLDR